MKKSFLVPTALLILLAALALGAHHWLRGMVQEQTRLALSNYSITPGGAPAKATMDTVDFSPLSRTLRLENVRLTDAETGIEATADSIVLRLSPRFLLAMTPLRGLALPKDPDALLTIVEHLLAKGLAWKQATGTCTLKLDSADNIRATAGLVTRLLDGQEIDPLDVLYQSGADRWRATGLRFRFAPGSGQSELSLDEDTLEGLERGSIRSLRLDGLRTLDARRRESFGMDRLSYANIKLPDQDLLRQMWQMVIKYGRDGDALWKALQPLLEKSMAGGSPEGNMRVGGLRLYPDGVSVRLDEGGLDWMSGPSRVTGFVKGLRLPRAVFKESGLRLPDITLDFSGDATFPDEANQRHSYSLKAPGLADADFSICVQGAGSISDKQALLARTYSDLRLDVQDRGALAWLGRNLGGDPAAASQVMVQALNGLGLPRTPENDRLLADIAAFVRHPGKLAVRSKPGTRIGLESLTESAGNPSALLSLQVTPGPVPLDAAIRALPE